MGYCRGDGPGVPVRCGRPARQRPACLIYFSQFTLWGDSARFAKRYLGHGHHPMPYRITLRSGQRVLVRALRPDDGPGLAEAFEQLSETSRYRRFFAVKPHLSEQSLAYFTDVDHHDHEALVAVAPDSGQLVGVARFIRDPREPDQAEVAVTVIDSWQRRGLGTVLLRELAQRAAEEGIRHFTAEILAETQPMLTLAHRLGPAETTLDGTTVSARIELLAAPQQAATFSSDGYGLLRAAARRSRRS